MFKKIQQIHCIGIGGSGMSGIAEVLLNRGFQVSGSDLKESAAVGRLRELGAQIKIGHSEENLGGADVVVVSTAVCANNPEILLAKSKKIPVIPRAEMLMELMRTKYGIAVAGSHGKTTTTSLIFSVLGAGGLDPTAVIGGMVNAIGSNARLGEGEYFVVEADESDGSFLRLTPTIAVLTNLDREHMDHYKDLSQLEKAFVEFGNRVPFYGTLVICSDDPGLQKIQHQFKRRVLTYGFEQNADIRGHICSREGRQTVLEVFRKDQSLGKIRLEVPGLHNVLNALASIAVGLECRVSFVDIQKGISDFSGIERRFHLRKEEKGVLVFDDYAHHPREIQATLRACRDIYPKRRLLAVFQPHRFSRLEDLFEEFVSSFKLADHLVVLPVYAAGEEARGRSDGANLSQAIIEKTGQENIFYCKNFKDAFAHLKNVLQEGDLLITMGAGDVWHLAEEICI